MELIDSSQFIVLIDDRESLVVLYVVGISIHSVCFQIMDIAGLAISAVD